MTSIAFRLAVAVACIVTAAYTAVGIILIDALEADLRTEAVERLLAPGRLLQSEQLQFDALSDRETMTRLLGEPLVEGVLVGRNGIIFHDLRPDRIESPVAEVTDFDPDWFSDTAVTTRLIEQENDGVVTLTAVTPLFTGNAQVPYFHALLRVDLTGLAREAAILKMWIVSLGLGAGFFVIIGVMIAFRGMILQRLRALATIAEDVAHGRLDINVRNVRADEIGALERTMGRMTEALGERSRERDEALALLHHNEDRLRDYALSASEWFWETDTDHRFTRVGDRFCRLIGVRSETCIGFRLDQVLAAAGAEADSEPVRRFAATLIDRQPVRELEFHAGKVAGQDRYFTLSGVPASEPADRFAGYRGTGRDITSRKVDELELRRLKDAAEQASVAKSKFLSSVSHELRTPLNAILGYAQVLQLGAAATAAGHCPAGVAADDQGMPVTLAEGAAEIVNATKWLTGQLDQILLFSRQQHDKLRQDADIDLRGFLDGKLSDFRTTIQARGLIVDNRVAAGHHVCAPESVLDLVFGNLLSNAIKYSHDGGHIDLRCEQRAGGICRVTVRDHGIGIGLEHGRRIFDPFERGDQYNSTIHGTGLGLAIAAEAAAEIGARLDYTSVPAQGSAFYLDLPPDRVVPDRVVPDKDPAIARNAP